MTRVLAGMMLCAAAVWGQTEKFDVASVKGGMQPIPDKPRGEGVEVVPGSLSMRSVRLVSAIAWAYEIQEWQVDGPPWISQERYDIVAKAAEAAPPAKMRQMLRALLAERLKLAIHHQNKDMEGVVITVGKNGHKLKETDKVGSVKMIRQGAQSEGGTVSELVAILTRESKMPALDETGLKGHYDFKLDFSGYITPEMKPETDMVAMLAAAFQGELGLKLTTKKFPVDMVMIDKLEKVPTEN